MSEQFPSSWRATASWSRADRFWLGWPKSTKRREEDDARRDDCVALAQLLSDHAPVTMIAGFGDVVECSLHMPTGVTALGADLESGILSEKPLWLSDSQGQIAVGIAQDAQSHRRWAAAAGLSVVDLPADWKSDVIESDGEGTALVLDRLAVGLQGGRVSAERLLENLLGITRVIWLTDPGSGKIPARFLAPGLVAAPLGHSSHPAYAALSANSDRLRAASDRRGRMLDVVELPCPGNKLGCYSDLMAAGDLVLVPEFDDGKDSEAYDRIVAALPESQIVCFPATYIAPCGGGLAQAVTAQPSATRNRN